MFERFWGPKWDNFVQKSVKSISETKMEAQGDQTAPKAPKLKAEAAQSLPKIAQSPPKTPKVVQKASKSGQKIEQNW